jgi:ubiquitin
LQHANRDETAVKIRMSTLPKTIVPSQTTIYFTVTDLKSHRCILRRENDQFTCRQPYQRGMTVDCCKGTTIQQAGQTFFNARETVWVDGDRIMMD